MQGRDVAIIGGAVVLIVLLVGLLGGGMMGSGIVGPGMMGPGMTPFGWLFMLLVVMLVIGGIVALVVWLLRQGQPAAPAADAGGGRALDILRERYARGEIGREEYERMRADLLRDGRST